MSNRRLLQFTLAAASLLLASPVVPPATASPTCPPPSAAVLTATRPTLPRTVALTFDDGPSEYTVQILAILKKYRVHATFFETGAHVSKYPEVSRAVVAAGNKIGNHTYTHPQSVAGSVPRGSFDTLPVSVQSRQMDRTTRTILRATGRRPCFFRAPGGRHFGWRTQQLAQRRGMSVTHWTISTGDSGQPGVLQLGPRGAVHWILRNGTSGAGRHPIILMHDGKASPEPENVVSSFRGNTVAALPRIIRFYQRHGYVFTDPSGHRFR